MAVLGPEQFEWLREDPRRLIAALVIPDKDGRRVRFGADLQAPQKAIITDLADPSLETIVYNKPRQVRASSTVLAWAFSRLYFATDPLTAILATNYVSTNDELWGRLRGYYFGLPRPLQASLAQQNQKTMQFLRSGSRIKCLSSASPAGARSATAQILLADEVAYWFHDEQLWADLTSTQGQGPNRRTVVLSTPNGAQNLFHRLATAAEREQRLGNPRVRFRFFEWYQQREYATEPPDGWEPTEEEYRLGKQHGLTPAQLYWRHQKIHGPDGIGLHRFRREFPTTPDEGFLDLADRGWFDPERLHARLVELRKRPEITGRLRLYRRPEAGASYAIGADPSLCTGGDYAVAQVVDDEGNQVATFATNTGTTESFADGVAELSNAYHRARVLVEGNAGGGGNIVLSRLRQLGVPLWTAPPAPGARARTKPTYWTTHHGNKEAAYSHLRQIVDGELLTLFDVATVQELLHIREEDGTIEGRDGYHDDHAMALALAAWNAKTLPKRPREPAYRPKQKGAAPDLWGVTRPR